MTIQFSDSVRNGRLNAIETAVGTSAVLKIRTGTQPATCATADSGTVLATLNLDSNWMLDASSGSMGKTGTWSDTSADAAGTAGHFRLYASNGTTCHMQGSITATGGGGDMELDNTSIASGQQVSIATFTLTDGGA